MLYSDSTRTGSPFAKDPSVVRFRGRYLLYYSMPPIPGQGWAVGIAESDDLDHWSKVGELLPSPDHHDSTGLAAPGAVVLDGRVHLFYQSYGHGPKDAICHAVSDDGVRFTRTSIEPVFRPRGPWCVGRAIDADAFAFNGRLYLYYATRDPQMKVQMLGVASADLASDFSASTWTDHNPDGPLLKPELSWEQDCIEAPTVCQHGSRLYLFYGGAYNCAPQQIGVAVSTDAVRWTRRSDRPLLAHGPPGAWNESESGHPGVFVDADGTTHLFFQGSADRGKTWFLSRVRLDWADAGPSVAR
jgi:predicted GH43/DUF377 family glycosyl hydrolase